jgi:hypothetical protein
LREADTGTLNFGARRCGPETKYMDLLRDHSIAFSFGRRYGLVIQPLAAGSRIEDSYRAGSVL